MPDTNREVRPFTKFLHDQRRGALHDDLGTALADVCAAVVEHNKAGQLTITLKIHPSGDGMVQIADTVVAKIPVGDKAASMFWVDGHGNVMRSNPAQAELPLRAMPDREEASA